MTQTEKIIREYNRKLSQELIKHASDLPEGEILESYDALEDLEDFEADETI